MTRFNPFESFRMRNLLGSRPPVQERPSPTFDTGFISPSGGRDMMNRIRTPLSSDEQYQDEFSRLYGQPGPAIQAYRQHLDALPNREDHKPGWMTRIASALSGMSAGYRDPGEGIRVAQDLNSSGYNSALQDYANKGAGLRERAGMEQEELEARIKALHNARAMGLKYDEFELKRLEAERRHGVNQQNADTQRMRAEAYIKAQNRPNFEAHVQSDGSVLYVNKADPSIREEVPASAVEAYTAQTGRINANTNVRRTNIYGRSVDQAHQRGMANIEADRTRPISSTDQMNARKLAIEELMHEPEFSEFIINEEGKPLELGPPPEQGWGESEEEFQERMENYEALKQELSTRINGILTRRR